MKKLSVVKNEAFEVKKESANIFDSLAKQLQEKLEKGDDWAQWLIKKYGEGNLYRDEDGNRPENLNELITEDFKVDPRITEAINQAKKLGLGWGNDLKPIHNGFVEIKSIKTANSVKFNPYRPEEDVNIDSAHDKFIVPAALKIMEEKTKQVYAINKFNNPVIYVEYDTEADLEKILKVLEESQKLPSETVCGHSSGNMRTVIALAFGETYLPATIVAIKSKSKGKIWFKEFLGGLTNWDEESPGNSPRQLSNYECVANSVNIIKEEPKYLFLKQKTDETGKPNPIRFPNGQDKDFDDIIDHIKSRFYRTQLMKAQKQQLKNYLERILIENGSVAATILKYPPNRFITDWLTAEGYNKLFKQYSAKIHSGELRVIPFALEESGDWGRHLVDLTAALASGKEVFLVPLLSKHEKKKELHKEETYLKEVDKFMMKFQLMVHRILHKESETSILDRDDVNYIIQKNEFTRKLVIARPPMFINKGEKKESSCLTIIPKKPVDISIFSESDD
tara:strand:- start:246 stop:1766 length:1521 start_codon:yes stop_codon:yes gene_type:complete